MNDFVRLQSRAPRINKLFINTLKYGWNDNGYDLNTVCDSGNSKTYTKFGPAAIKEQGRKMHILLKRKSKMNMSAAISKVGQNNDGNMDEAWHRLGATLK